MSDLANQIELDEASNSKEVGGFKAVCPTHGTKDVLQVTWVNEDCGCIRITLYLSCNCRWEL